MSASRLFPQMQKASDTPRAALNPSVYPGGLPVPSVQLSWLTAEHKDSLFPTPPLFLGAGRQARAGTRQSPHQSSSSPSTPGGHLQAPWASSCRHAETHSSIPGPTGTRALLLLLSQGRRASRPGGAQGTAQSPAYPRTGHWRALMARG